MITFFEGKKVDLILSDMSPNSSGNKKIDHLRIISIIEKVLDISNYFLSKTGYWLLKFFKVEQGRFNKKNEKNIIIQLNILNLKLLEVNHLKLI